MNKTLKSLAAIALIALSAAACQKEQLFDSQNAGEETVTFTVSPHLAATKAEADGDGQGANLTRCLVAVYMHTGDALNPYKLYDTPTTTKTDNEHYTFSVNLIRKQTYQIVVWADKGKYTVDRGLTSISREDGDLACNSDAYDAFFASEVFTQGTSSTAIEAKRPFAQLNLITTDLRDGFEPSDIKLTYTANTKFDALNNTASNPVEVTYSSAEHYYRTLSAPGANTVAMNYLLVGNEQVVLNAVKLKVTFTDDVDITVANVPVKRNYRTNIKGNLFTEQTDFNITVNPIWGDPDSEVGNITTGLRKVNGVYEVSAAEGLSYASANIFAQSGGQFVLTEDIDMTGYTSSYALTRAASGTYTSAKIDVQADILVIDGNGHKITKLPGMLIAYTGNLTKLEIKNLTLENPAVVYDLNDELTGPAQAGVGAFVGYAGTSDEITIDNCHIQGGYVRGGHWTGGFVGYAAGYNTANNGPVFETLSITNCSITDAEVSGKGSVGGIIGHATGDIATLTKIDAPTVLRNTITSTGSETNKAGSVVATVGCAGPAAWNGQKGGVYLTSCNVLGNTVKSGNVANTKLWGRQGNDTAELYVDGVKVEDFDETPAAPSASVNGTDYPSLAAAISETAGDVTVVIEPGDHTLPTTNLAGRSITLKGLDPNTTVIDMSAGDTPQYRATSVTFENVTVKRKSSAYGGLSHCGEEHYVNSKVYGTLVTYAPVVTAVNTEFYQTSDKYNIHIYAEGSVNLVNCKFYCMGKSIYAHHEAASQHSISIKDCVFTASQTVSGRAAIQLHTELGIYGTLDITNCTATGFDSTINGGLWNELNNSNKAVTDKFLKTVDGNIVVRTDNGLTKALAAVEDGGTVQILKSGEYALQTLTGANYTLEAVADGVVLKHTPGYGSWIANCTAVTVKNLTWDVGVERYQYFKDVNVENCTIKGCPYGHTKVNFKECTFVVESSNDYNIWTYGAEDAVFDGCTFNCAGKSVLVYNESGDPCNVTLKNCEFTASHTVTGKAAIQIHTDFGISGTLNITNCTATGFDSTIHGGLWNELNNQTKVPTNNFVKTVDGVQQN